MLSEPELKNLEERSHVGDLFKTFRENGSLALLKKYILDRITQDAFNGFGITPADDKVAIIGFQQMKIVSERIEKRINQYIEEGKLAKQQILDYEEALPLKEDV